MKRVTSATVEDTLALLFAATWAGRFLLQCFAICFILMHRNPKRKEKLPKGWLGCSLGNGSSSIQVAGADFYKTST